MSEQEPTKTLIITCQWESVHHVVVPADFEVTGNLSDFPPEVLEELKPIDAALVDWQ